MSIEENSPNDEHSGNVALYRLFQLFSPSLPIGGFTYSQGLEWAVEANWVKNKNDMVNWLSVVLSHSMTTLELPVLRRLYHAVAQQDHDAIAYWNAHLFACRESYEFRAEERQRGEALFRLLRNLGVIKDAALDNPNQLHGFCLAAHHWRIAEETLLQGYLWGWAENTVMAGVKLIPLGQTAGQEALIELSSAFPDAIERSNTIEDHDISACTPALAIASSKHETQYTRLFRS